MDGVNLVISSPVVVVVSTPVSIPMDWPAHNKGKGPSTAVKSQISSPIISGVTPLSPPAPRAPPPRMKSPPPPEPTRAKSPSPAELTRFKPPSPPPTSEPVRDRAATMAPQKPLPPPAFLKPKLSDPAMPIPPPKPMLRPAGGPSSSGADGAQPDHPAPPLKPGMRDRYGSDRTKSVDFLSAGKY